jgi:peptide/nickel transport system substrate-binding protein
MLQRRWIRLAAATSLAAIMTATAVVTTASGHGVVGGGGTVVIWTNLDYTDLDFQLRTVSGSAYSTELGYDELITFGQDNTPNAKQRFVPYLADSWKVTPKAVTFHLRKGPKCQDGTPITPTVVANSMKRMLDVSVSLSSAFNGTQGGNGVAPTGTGPFLVSANDKAGTVTFRSSNPNNELLTGFNGHTGAQGGQAKIVCPSGLANPDKLRDQEFGSGPYRLVSASHGDKIVYQLWPDWTWGPNGASAKRQGMPDTIVYQIVSNPTTAVNLALTGDIDILRAVPTTEQSRLEASGQFNVIDPPAVQQIGGVFGGFSVGSTMWFNVTRVPDIHIREALMSVLDRKTYIQASGVNGATPATGAILPTAPCYKPGLEKLYPNYPTAKTPDQARAYLVSNGFTYKDGQLYKPDGSKLTIEVLSTNANPGGNAYVYDQWSKMGVDVNAQFLDTATYGTRAGFQQYDAIAQAGMVGIGRFIGPGYPNGVNQIVTPPGPEKTKFERVVRLALGVPVSQRCPYWDQAAQMVAQYRWVMPWFYGGPTAKVYVRKGITYHTWGGLSTEMATKGIVVTKKIRD